MGFRFQRRIKVLPGVHANLSKGGMSVSVGPTGLKTTIGKNGVKTSVGIPGTGIRYEIPWKSGDEMEKPRIQPEESKFSHLGVLGDNLQQHGQTVTQQTTMKSDLELYQKSMREVTSLHEGLIIYRVLYFAAFFFSLLGILSESPKHPDHFLYWGLALAVAIVIDICCHLNVKKKKAAAEALWARYEAEELQKIQNEVEDWFGRCMALDGVITIQSDLPCQKGEGVLLEEHFASMQEPRKVRGYKGSTSDEWTTLSEGTIYVTNKRLIFLGNPTNRSIPLGDIVHSSFCTDSLSVSSVKRSKPVRFLCQKGGLMFIMMDFVKNNPNMRLVNVERPDSQENSQFLAEDSLESSSSKQNESTKEEKRQPDGHRHTEELERAHRARETAEHEYPCHATELKSSAETLLSEDEDCEMCELALEAISATRRASTSTIQRRLRIGYARAAQIMNFLEELHYIGPARGAEPREILFNPDNLDLDAFRKAYLRYRVLPISSGYLELVQEAAEAIGAFVAELSEDEDVESLLQRIEGIDGVETLGLFSTKKPKLGFLVAEDVIKCVAGLGYQWDDLGNAEAAGIWLALSQVGRFPESSIGDWNDRVVRDMVRQSLAAFSRRLQEAVPLAFDGDEFLFNFVLSNGDDSKGYGRRFTTLMYRWASIVAKADGLVTPAESAFLAKIVKMGGVMDAAPVSAGKVKADPVVSKPMRDLERMVGLGVVKEEVSKLANLVRIQQERERQGIKAVSVSYHCVFTGNPGTGKTTVARIVAGIYKDLGVLKKGHLVETDRAGLVAEYVGQTGPKTNKVVDSALDGVLFIDEAYSLVEGGQNDYGKEAVATLLKRMEDDRARLVVILAGYGENMKRFIESNPGLQSRFNRYIEFPDYGAADLVEIFKRFAKGSQYRLGAGAEGALRGVMEEAVAHKDEQFGNGRFARNVFEKAIERQAMRLAGVGSLTKEMLQELLPEDIVGA